MGSKSPAHSPAGTAHVPGHRGPPAPQQPRLPPGPCRPSPEPPEPRVPKRPALGRRLTFRAPPAHSARGLGGQGVRTAGPSPALLTAHPAHQPVQLQPSPARKLLFTHQNPALPLPAVSPPLPTPSSSSAGPGRARRQAGSGGEEPVPSGGVHKETGPPAPPSSELQGRASLLPAVPACSLEPGWHGLHKAVTASVNR